MAKSTRGTKNLKEALTPDQVSKVEDKYKSIYSGMLKGNKKKLMKYIDPKLKRPNPDAMAMGRAINLVKKETETVNEEESISKEPKIGDYIPTTMGRLAFWRDHQKPRTIEKYKGHHPNISMITGDLKITGKEKTKYGTYWILNNGEYKISVNKLKDGVVETVTEEESVNEGLPPGYGKFLVSLQMLITDIAPNAWGNKSQIRRGDVKRIHNSLKKRYEGEYEKFNNLLKNQSGTLGDWYLEEPINESFSQEDWDIKWKMPKDNLFNATKTTDAVNNRYKALQSLLKSKPEELRVFDADENHPAYNMSYDELMKWYNELTETVTEATDSKVLSAIETLKKVKFGSKRKEAISIVLAAAKAKTGEHARTYKQALQMLDLEEPINEQMDVYDDIAQSEFGMDYEQLGSGEQEWVRDEIDNMELREESVNEYINPGYQIETKYFDPNEVKAVADQLQAITDIENIQYKEFKWADGTGGLSFTISSDYRDTGLDYFVRLEHTYDGKWKSKVFATYGAGASEVDFGEVDLNIDMEGFTNMKDITKETFRGVWDKMLRAAAPALKSKRREMEAHQSKSNQSQRDFYKDRGQTSGTIDERLATLVKEVYSEKQRKWACSQDGPEFDEMCKDTAISKKKLEEERTSTVNKARAKSELKQMLKGKRDDGMGKSTLKAVLAIDKDGKETKVKKLEDFDKFEKGTKFSLKETTMNNDRLTELIKAALTGPVKEESTPLKEGVWSMGTVTEINRFIKDIKEMKNHYYDIVGSDDVFDGLDRAEMAAKELAMNAPENRDMNEELATTPIKDDIYAIGSRIYKDPYEAISLVATDQTVVVRDFARKDKKFKAAVMDYVKSKGLQTSVDRDGLYIDTKPLDFKGMPLMNEKKQRPDYPDIDGDGDIKEPMAQAAKDKEKAEANESFDSLAKKLDKQKGITKDEAAKIAGSIAAKKRAGAGKGPTAKQKKRMAESILKKLRG